MVSLWEGCVQIFATPWAVARQGPLSMGFSRLEYWWVAMPSSRVCPWDFPGKNTGVGCHALLQGIVQT